MSEVAAKILNLRTLHVFFLCLLLAVFFMIGWAQLTAVSMICFFSLVMNFVLLSLLKRDAIVGRVFKGAEIRDERATVCLGDVFNSQLHQLHHQLKTPLNVINGYSAAVVSDDLGAIDEGRMREYLKDIHVCGCVLQTSIDAHLHELEKHQQSDERRAQLV